MPYSHAKVSRVQPEFAILFDNEKEFNATESALAKIKSGPNGSRLLNAVVSEMTAEKFVQIRTSFIPEETNGTGGRLTASQLKTFTGDPRTDSYSYNEAMYHYASNGQGVRPIVFYNPTDSISLDRQGRPKVIKDEKSSFISLAHELVHAYYMMRGESFGRNPETEAFNDPEHLREEIRAVGFQEYLNNPLSENAVRRDHKLPLRYAYFATS